MKPSVPRARSRRRFIRGATTVLLSSTGLWPRLDVFAQDPPNGCPTPPSGGAHFQPGQDTRPIVLRKSITSLSHSEVATLQNAFKALRNLGAGDPRTWILQADMHALYCQQCANDNTQIHFMWNFF